tara:strand:+ start:1716 stop:1976 length:261 start_codon:yes stop_codon:yes gene_type:complete
MCSSFDDTFGNCDYIDHGSFCGPHYKAQADHWERVAQLACGEMELCPNASNPWPKPVCDKFNHKHMCVNETACWLAYFEQKAREAE